jgi:hypothetical protein
MNRNAWHRLPLVAIGSLLALLTLAIACKHIPTAQELQASARAKTYLVKDSTLANQFLVSARGVELFDADTARKDRAPEAVIYWDEVELFRKLIYALPTDSLLHLYSSKGDRHWEAAHFEGLPAPPTPFIYNPQAAKPLQGLKVALDPGHVGGLMDYAQFLEEKFVRILPDEANGYTEEIGFCEGNLALGTALVLAERLRGLGAEVILTREVEGLNAFGLTFDQWLGREVQRQEKWLAEHGQQVNRAAPDAWRLRCAGACYVRDFNIPEKDADFWRNKATLAQIHRIAFLKAEFVERAKKINAFRPHLTFIIHYNVGANNETAQNGYRKALPDNYCMTFIPGSFMGGEMREPGDRLAFAAKLLTDDIPRSERLCAAVLRAHVERLHVPIMVWDERLTYLQNASLRTAEKGVFARNLQLTRLINGTLCFGESLLQDNLTEARQLNARDFTPVGMTTPVPNRIREVADAYYDGLIAWLQAQ